MSLIPNIPPKLFSLSAVTVGYLLIDDLDSSEQNALGSWFMLLGQTLCTNASSHFVKERVSKAGTIPSRESDYTKRMLYKTKRAIDNYLKNY